MKILITNYMETTYPGGINKTIREIAKNLSKRGYEVTVLQPNPFNLVHEEYCDGYKIIRIKSKFGEYFHELSPEMHFYIKKNLKDLNPDIIHLHGYHTLFSAGVVYSITKTDLNIPIIFSPHFDIFSHDSFAGNHLWDFHNNFIGKKIMKYPKIILAASKFESKNIYNILNVPKEKIKVISHGVDKFNFKKIKSKKSFINLIYAGYLMELKGVQHILKAVHILNHKRNIEAHLTIIGEGPYENQLRKISNRLNINQFVEWKEFIPPSRFNELLDYYSKSDIFLLLSKSENYGIVIPEALAMGTPAIVTKRTALMEFLDEPGCFSVDYPPDPGKVADLIIKITEKKIDIGPFSSKIRTWDKAVDDYEKIYEIVGGV